VKTSDILLFPGEMKEGAVLVGIGLGKRKMSGNAMEN